MDRLADQQDTSNRKPYRPAIGKEFEIDEVPTIEARTRSFLARVVAVSATTALTITGLYGLTTAQFGPVEAVWAIAGPLVGAVMAYYFGVHRGASG